VPDALYAEASGLDSNAPASVTYAANTPLFLVKLESADAIRGLGGSRSLWVLILLTGGL